MVCTRDGAEVGADDGCTRGEPGIPQTACHEVSVSIEGHEAIYGDQREG